MVNPIQQPEAQLQYLAFFIGKIRQRFLHVLPQTHQNDGFHWFGRVYVLNIIAKRAVFFVPNRGLQRNRLLTGFQDLLNFDSGFVPAVQQIRRELLARERVFTDFQPVFLRQQIRGSRQLREIRFTPKLLHQGMLYLD